MKTGIESFKGKDRVCNCMLYRAIAELEDMDLVHCSDDKGYVLTDAGRIARL